jgi:hypothetical protein
MVGALVGSDRYEFESRLDAQLTFNEVPTDQKDVWLSERAHWIMGTPHDALHQLQAYADAGCERIVLQDLLPRDLDLIDLLGALAPDVMRPSART